MYRRHPSHVLQDLKLGVVYFAGRDKDRELLSTGTFVFFFFIFQFFKMCFLLLLLLQSTSQAIFSMLKYFSKPETPDVQSRLFDQCWFFGRPEFLLPGLVPS